MVFSTHIFLFVFLPTVLTIYYLAPMRWRALVLTFFSYLFYSWTNPWWTILMVTSTVIDYTAGRVIAKGGGEVKVSGDEPVLEPGGYRSRRQKIALTVSIVANLGMLGFFKYAGFLAINANAMASFLGLSDSLVPVLEVALPVGISFYTFQSMSYTIDVYRGKAPGMRNMSAFACYVALFPQLVAGPIVRYNSIADQLEVRSHTLEKFTRGVALFSLGMGKKILLANPMGHIADASFAAGPMHAADAWYGIVAYALQIYFDFSAYSDMAIGLALMFGFVFPKNFNSPYLADSITTFWQRWHISLSTWLRDYLYIPLGGNRCSAGRTYVNLMVVMLLGGLWHGASWNFIIWGGIHGGMLAFERMQGKDSPYRRLPRPLRVLITFLIVCIAWVFFRADTLPEAMAYLSSMFALSNPADGSALLIGVTGTPYHLFMLVLGLVIVWTFPQVWDYTRRLTPFRAAVCAVVFAVSVFVMWTQTANPFLYFQF
ncbi:MAG: MBOAT family protein [Opitutales bacterium]|nr:MBOAT family protein [Opitutales bacterium]